MASFYLPTKNTAIFDSTLFTHGEEGLTKAEADKAYVTYPTSQGPVALLGLLAMELRHFQERIR